MQDTPKQARELERIREDLDELRSAGFWKQLRAVYGEPKVYEVRLPMERNNVQFRTEAFNFLNHVNLR